MDPTCKVIGLDYLESGQGSPEVWPANEESIMVADQKWPASKVLLTIVPGLQKLVGASSRRR